MCQRFMYNNVFLIQVNVQQQRISNLIKMKARSKKFGLNTYFLSFTTPEY